MPERLGSADDLDAGRDHSGPAGPTTTTVPTPSGGGGSPSGGSGTTTTSGGSGTPSGGSGGSSPAAPAIGAPTQLGVTHSTATQISISWAAPAGSVAVSSYEAYLDGTLAGTTSSTTTTYAFSGLSCGTTHQVAVDATGTAGQRSAKTSLTTATAACPDTTPPTAPTGLAVSSVTQTSLTFTWSPSTDNVGVTGYAVSKDGSQLGYTTTTSYPITGLSCGTTSPLAVDAVDAAGNASARPSLGATTSSCAVNTRTPSAAPPPTTTTASTPSTPPATGQVSLSPSGSDSSCSRGGSACATFNRAYEVANGGDTVVVHAGQYAQDAPNIGGNEIAPDPSKTGVVTFVCAGDGNVTFAGPIFNFWAGLNGVTFQGDCFHFHLVYIGEGGYSQQTSNITLDDVHMETFNIMGAANVTIENSEVGPFVACYEPGDGSGAPSYSYCNTSDPAQAYWASQGGTYQVQQEPFVHNGDAGAAENITLANDVIHGISSTWNETHTGGLLFWSTENLHITGSTFSNDAIYDILENQDSTDTGLEIEGNTFGNPVYSQDPTENPGAPLLAPGWQEVELGSSGDTLTNATVSGNTFTNGLRFSTGNTFDSVVVSGNKLGAATTCPIAGVTFTGNDSCG